MKSSNTSKPFRRASIRHWTQTRRESVALLTVVAFSWIAWAAFSAFRSARWDQALLTASTDASAPDLKSSTADFLAFLDGLPGPPAPPFPRTKSQAKRTSNRPYSRPAESSNSSYPPRPVAPALASIELNTVDSSSLEALPSIGPILSGRIVKYRQVLGGYHAPTQLREVWGMSPDRAASVIPWFTADSGLIHRLCADTATWSALRRHPYIGADGARLIERYRAHHQLDSAHHLRASRAITDSLFDRWSPYLKFGCNYEFVFPVKEPSTSPDL